MGYTTKFIGTFTLDRPLTQKHYQWLKDFADEQHDIEPDVPSLYCQWIPIDKTHIGWSGGEKFYEYEEWITWLIEHFFEPRGYVLNGEVEWHGEEYTDHGKIIISDNIVTKKLGQIVYR